MKRFFFLGIISLWGIVSYSQLRISSGSAEEWVKENFNGQGVVIGNVKQSGNPASVAIFTSSTNILQIKSGLILSTGNALSVGGLNDKYNITTAFSDNPQTDTELSKLVAQKLFDIRSLEFDFVPMANSIQFNYQFGSDEYPEYIGSAYNDIFAFFVSDDDSIRNIALVPGKKLAVNINNINSQVEPALFTDNNVFSAFSVRKAPRITSKTSFYRRSFIGKMLYSIKKLFISDAVEESEDRIIIRPDQSLMNNIQPDLYRNMQFDGITHKLVAQMYVQPYKKYHLKLIIADVADNIYDSGVFIEGGSFTAKRDENQPGFVNYPNLQGIIEPNKILNGKNINEILPDQFELPNTVIYFDSDKYNIMENEVAKLNDIAEFYKKVSVNYSIRVAGHTDSIGNLKYNTELSKNRNNAVLEYLSNLTLKPVKASSAEKAFLEPVATNATEDGRHKNRRVEIYFDRIKNGE